MDVMISQKQHDEYYGGAWLFAIYCNTKINVLDGILVTYACNVTF